jgi:CubicO group peptidase (beta-lactamase class C family)
MGKSIFVLWIIFSSCFAQNQKMTKNLSDYEQQILLLMDKYKIPGMSIGVSFNDSVVYSKGFGFANIERKIQPDGNTPYSIASLTKPFAAAVIMRLVEENKLNLDSKIKDLYPGYEERCKRILGYFREEMPEYTFMLENYHPERNDITLRHHLTHTSEKTPGDEYKYNGFLFGMLSVAVETATDANFDELMDSMIIDHLNLKNTASSQLDKSKKAMLSKIALPYNSTDSGFTRVDFPNPKLNAGAGIISSVNDLMIFDKAINTNVLVSEKTKNLQFQPYRLNDGSLSPYGYGWFTQKYKDQTLVWHYGHHPGSYSALYLKVLEKNLTLIILANCHGLSSDFDLGKGDVIKSDFAKTFLDLFVSK